MGKFALFRAVLRADYAGLAVIGILTVIIAIYYYMKVVIAMYMRPAAPGLTVPGVDPAGRLAGAVILAAIIFLGLWPSPLFTLTARMAATLPLPF
jgi:NADH-quinone oxidoreductase subunit N